jgi:RNA polymerase sigma factor (sigma-70 family)
MSGSDAADAVQTTWLRLVEHLDDIQRPEAIGAWLATTLRRECVRLRQRDNRQCPMDMTAWDISDEAADVERQIVQHEEQVALVRATRLLPIRQQILLRMLTTTPRPSYEEIAAALDIPVGSIGPTRARALRRLRQLLDSTGTD